MDLVHCWSIVQLRCNAFLHQCEAKYLKHFTDSNNTL